MPDAEVKTRLVIENEGDPQIFRNAATAVQDLAAAIQSLQSAGSANLAPLLAQLDQLIAKANDAANALQQLNQP